MQINETTGMRAIFCSPEDSSIKEVFTDMQITECAWKAHDGQLPDADS